MKPTRLLALSCLLALSALSSSACVIVADDDSESTLLVANDSDYFIYELYLTEVDNPDWGRNFLAGDFLAPGEDFLITDIECDFYDALLVDEDGVECELLDVDLCFDDATWVIRNNTCTVFAAKGEEGADDGAKDSTPAPGI